MTPSLAPEAVSYIALSFGLGSSSISSRLLWLTPNTDELSGRILKTMARGYVVCPWSPQYSGHQIKPVGHSQSWGRPISFRGKYKSLRDSNNNNKNCLQYWCEYPFSIYLNITFHDAKQYEVNSRSAVSRMQAPFLGCLSPRRTSLCSKKREIFFYLFGGVNWKFKFVGYASCTEA